MSLFWCVKPIESPTKYMSSVLNKHQPNTCFHTVLPPVSVNYTGNCSPSVGLLTVAPYCFTIVSADFQLNDADIKFPHCFSPHHQLKMLTILDLLQENIWCLTLLWIEAVGIRTMSIKCVGITLLVFRSTGLGY